MKISFGGHEFILHPSGALLWPDRNIILVADLHLEKGSHFAARGFFLPPYDTHRTLTKLLALCRNSDLRQVIILGDCFHDPKGYARLKPQDRALFDDLLHYDPIWIKGNHDGDFVPPGFPAYDVLELEGIFLRHEADSECAPEISGHYHPKAPINHKGSLLSLPCFVEDGRKLILPAFGAYTGGLNCEDAVLKKIFPQGCKTYALGSEKVYRLQSSDNC